MARAISARPSGSWVHSAKQAKNQLHRRITAKAPQCGSARICCFFSGEAQLAQKTAVTAAEVGSGVVPIDKAQRAQREAAGRLAILLAQQAQEVVRVFCGIPTRIK